MSWQAILKKEYRYEHEAIEAAQKLANKTGRKQNVVAIRDDEDYSVEYQITEEEVFDGPMNWLVLTVKEESQ